MDQCLGLQIELLASANGSLMMAIDYHCAFADDLKFIAVYDYRSRFIDPHPAQPGMGNL